MAPINHDEAEVDLHFGQARRSDFNYLASIRTQASINQSSVQLAAQLYPNRSRVWNWPDDALAIDQSQKHCPYLSKHLNFDPAKNLTWGSLDGLARDQGAAALAAH